MSSRSTTGGAASGISAEPPVRRRPRLRRPIIVLGVGVIAWGVPKVAVVVFTGRNSVFTEQGLFFSGTALVTFGGAYAVLAFAAQKAVETCGWLSPGEMVRGSVWPRPHPVR